MLKLVKVTWQRTLLRWFILLKLEKVRKCSLFTTLLSTHYLRKWTTDVGSFQKLVSIQVNKWGYNVEYEIFAESLFQIIAYYRNVLTLNLITCYSNLMILFLLLID